MRESDVEKHLTKRVKAFGGDVRKVTWIAHRGAPDRLVMLPEVVSNGPAGTIPAERFLVELKAPGKKLKAHQRREHERLRKYGWRIEVVDGIEDVEELFR